MLEPTIPFDKIKEFEKKFFAGKFPNQRYGQAFCNQFNLTCRALFYEEDYRLARIKAWLNFAIFPDDFLEEENEND